MAIESNAQSTDISALISNMETTMTSEVPILQISKSSELNNAIFNMLNIVNQETYSYAINIGDFIRNNIKDASFLKAALIEKIHKNMGD